MNQYLDDILDSLEFGRCVILLGPNVPVDDKGRTLRKGIIEYCRDLKGFELENDLDGLFSFKDRRDETRFPTIQKKYILKHFTPSTVHEYLAQIPVPLILSLTPDHLQEEAFHNLGIEVNFSYYNKRIPENTDYTPSKDEPLIYNLFGSIYEPDSLITTQDDLFNFLFSILDKSNPLPEPIESFTDQARLYLFIGFDFQQWYLKILLRLLKLHEDPLALSTEPIHEFTGPTRHFYEKHFKMVFVSHNVEAFMKDIQDACKAKGMLREAKESGENQVRQKIIQYMKNDDLMEALELLEDHFEKYDQENYGVALVLSGRYNNVSRRFQKGVVSQEQMNLELSGIRDSILELTKQIAPSHSSS